MSDKITSFEDLECWQTCRRLRIFVAKTIAPSLPKEDRYRWASQTRRSARSTTANIAEGYGRFHYLDHARFCSNARGSWFEKLDHLIAVNDEELISGEMPSEGRKLVSDAGKILNGYIKYLQKKAAA